MINEIIKSLNLQAGYLLHKGHIILCPNGHPLGVLNPIDGTDYIAVGNQIDEAMFTKDSTQPSLDSTLICGLCGAKGAQL